MLELQAQVPEQVEPILAGWDFPDTHVARAGEDPGLVRRTGDWAPVDLPEIDELCGQLAQAVSQWEFLVKQKNAIGNQVRAYVRCHKLGWSPGKGEAEAAKIEKQVEKILKAARDGTLDDPITTGLVLASDQAAEVFRKPAEKVMREAEKLVRLLPGSGFVAATRGLGAASVAKVVGVTGPLHNYRAPAKLWKRLGLGLVDEGAGKGPCRQGKRTDLDLALLHGYSPARRSISWNLYDSMFKNQSPEWRAIYDRKKAEYLTRAEAGETDARGHKRTRLWAEKAARRYTEKRVILHLWRAWMRDARGLP